MRNLLSAVALAFILILPACEFTGSLFGSGTLGYDELDSQLTEQERVQKGVFDAMASYLPVQIVLEQAVTNPNIPAELKQGIKILDAEAVAAILKYRAAVDAGSDDALALLETVMNALARGQVLLIQATAEGLL